MVPLSSSTLIREQIKAGLLKRIEAHEKGYRQNVGIVGPAGIGKSNLLSELFYTACGRHDLIPVYVNADAMDFPHLVDRWCGSVLSGLFRSQSISTPQTLASLFTAADPVVPRTVAMIKRFRRQVLRKEKNTALVKELFSLTEAMAEETGKKVLLILDEFHALESLPAKDPFVLLGKEIMLSKETLFVAASSMQERAKEIFSDNLSLLFGHFEIIELGPLGFEEVVDFLQWRMPAHRFTTALQRFLIHLTNGEPRYLDMILNRLEFILPPGKPCNIRTEDLIEAAFTELFDDKGRLSLIFQSRLHIVEHMAKDSSPHVRALVAISNGRRKLPAIAAAMECRPSEAKKVLMRLIKEELVQRTGSFYTLGDCLFKFWIRSVYQERCSMIGLDVRPLAHSLRRSLNELYHLSESEDQASLPVRIEQLLQCFRNDLIDVDKRKTKCPQFSEIEIRKAQSGLDAIFARAAKESWYCQIASDFIKEDEMIGILEEYQRHRRRRSKKILIVFSGVDQNARLMAQQAKVVIWSLKDVNSMLEFYDLPKIILLAGEQHPVGAVSLLS